MEAAGSRRDEERGRRARVGRPAPPAEAGPSSGEPDAGRGGGKARAGHPGARPLSAADPEAGTSGLRARERGPGGESRPNAEATRGLPRRLLVNWVFAPSGAQGAGLRAGSWRRRGRRGGRAKMPRRRTRRRPHCRTAGSETSGDSEGGNGPSPASKPTGEDMVWLTSESDRTKTLGL